VIHGQPAGWRCLPPFGEGLVAAGSGLRVPVRQGPRAKLSDKPGFGVELNRALPLHWPYEHG